jgi:protein TIF31
MESPDTCANSCFYLAFNGQRVNDYLELCDIEGITSESELELIEGKL